jgi:hypothetical protein
MGFFLGDMVDAGMVNSRRNFSTPQKRRAWPTTFACSPLKADGQSGALPNDNPFAEAGFITAERSPAHSAPCPKADQAEANFKGYFTLQDARQ